LKPTGDGAASRDRSFVNNTEIEAGVGDASRSAPLSLIYAKPGRVRSAFVHSAHEPQAVSSIEIMSSGSREERFGFTPLTSRLEWLDLKVRARRRTPRNKLRGLLGSVRPTRTRPSRGESDPTGGAALEEWSVEGVPHYKDVLKKMLDEECSRAFGASRELDAVAAVKE